MDIRASLDLLTPREEKPNLLRQLEEARLPLAPGRINVARGSYGAFVVVMHPMDFVRLTTEPQWVPKLMADEYVDLETFKKGTHPNYNKTQYQMPFLNVSYPSGRVTGHEGRHRALMVHKAGGDKFPCVVYLRQDDFFVVSYYEDEGASAPKMTRTFSTRGEARDFEYELKRLRNEPDHPFYQDIKIDPQGGWPLKGHPGRSDPDNWKMAKWRRDDMVPLIGQYDQSFVLPLSEMRVGIVKGYRHFKL